MRTRWTRTAFLLVGLAVVSGAAAFAQTDVAGSLFGAFSGSTSGNGTTQSPSNSAGGLLEVRHISSPLAGYEGTYSYNHANQTYTGVLDCPGINCPVTTSAAVLASAHEVTGDWIASIKVSKFRPFALAGGGILFNEASGPAASTTTATQTTSSTKGVFVYGAGLDWGLLPHIGVRLQYRGNLYKAPDLATVFTSTNKFMQTAEPMIGIYFRL